LKAIVGPWNNSNVDICSFNFTTGKSKLRVSSTIVFKISSGISGTINCFMASKAISALDFSSMVSKKDFGSGVIDSGKYYPLSGANPLTTASLKFVSCAFLFNE